MATSVSINLRTVFEMPSVTIPRI